MYEEETILQDIAQKKYEQRKATYTNKQCH